MMQCRWLSIFLISLMALFAVPRVRAKEDKPFDYVLLGWVERLYPDDVPPDCKSQTTICVDVYPLVEIHINRVLVGDATSAPTKIANMDHNSPAWLLGANYHYLFLVSESRLTLGIPLAETADGDFGVTAWALQAAGLADDCAPHMRRMDFRWPRSWVEQSTGSRDPIELATYARSAISDGHSLRVNLGLPLDVAVRAAKRVDQSCGDR
jgi:hypothetical protein